LDLCDWLSNNIKHIMLLLDKEIQVHYLFIVAYFMF